MSNSDQFYYIAILGVLKYFVCCLESQLSYTVILKMAASISYLHRTLTGRNDVLLCVSNACSRLVPVPTLFSNNRYTH